MLHFLKNRDFYTICHKIEFSFILVTFDALTSNVSYHLTEKFMLYLFTTCWQINLCCSTSMHLSYKKPYVTQERDFHQESIAM